MIGDGGKPLPTKVLGRTPPQLPATPMAPDALNRLTH
jgi:hypothetical protein